MVYKGFFIALYLLSDLFFRVKSVNFFALSTKIYEKVGF